eukprot:gene4959-5200_t
MDWEDTKENFVPVKQGRSVTALSTPLSTTSRNNELDDARRSFLDDIRTSDDPLAAWLKYIKWTQEQFTTQGSKSELQHVLEAATKALSTTEQYNNDVRLLRIWVQYADCLPDPSDVFLFLESRDIGRDHALLYEAYATYLELKGNYQQADLVFQEGINRLAKPVERLKQKYVAFQQRMAKRVQRQTSEVLLGMDSASGPAALAPARATLAPLDPTLPPDLDENGQVLQAADDIGRVAVYEDTELIAGNNSLTAQLERSRGRSSQGCAGQGAEAAIGSGNSGFGVYEDTEFVGSRMAEGAVAETSGAGGSRPLSLAAPRGVAVGADDMGLGLYEDTEFMTSSRLATAAAAGGGGTGHAVSAHDGFNMYEDTEFITRPVPASKGTLLQGSSAATATSMMQSSTGCIGMYEDTEFITRPVAVAAGGIDRLSLANEGLGGRNVMLQPVEEPPHQADPPQDLQQAHQQGHWSIMFKVVKSCQLAVGQLGLSTRHTYMFGWVHVLGRVARTPSTPWAKALEDFEVMDSPAVRAALAGRPPVMMSMSPAAAQPSPTVIGLLEIREQAERKSGAEAWSLRLHSSLVELSFQECVAKYDKEGEEVPFHRIMWFKQNGVIVWEADNHRTKAPSSGDFSHSMVAQSGAEETSAGEQEVLQPVDYSALPEECWVNVLQRLGVRELCYISRVSRSFLWSCAYERLFGQAPPSEWSFPTLKRMCRRSELRAGRWLEAEVEARPVGFAGTWCCQLDDTKVVSGDGSAVRLWAHDTGRRIATLRGHSDG